MHQTTQHRPQQRSTQWDIELAEDDRAAAMEVLEAIIEMLNQQGTNSAIEAQIGQLTVRGRQYLREVLEIHLETRGDVRGLGQDTSDSI